MNLLYWFLLTGITEFYVFLYNFLFDYQLVQDINRLVLFSVISIHPNFKEFISFWGTSSLKGTCSFNSYVFNVFLLLIFSNFGVLFLETFLQINLFSLSSPLIHSPFWLWLIWYFNRFVLKQAFYCRHLFILLDDVGIPSSASFPRHSSGTIFSNNFYQISQLQSFCVLNVLGGISNFQLSRNYFKHLLRLLTDLTCRSSRESICVDQSPVSSKFMKS